MFWGFFEHMNNSMFYNWRKIDGYNAPVTVVIGQRGLGKTYGKVKEGMFEFYEKGVRFVYVVETVDDVKTLSQNKGEKFFAGLKDELEKATSNRQKKLYKGLFSSTTEVEDGDTDLEEDTTHKVQGGTIKINGETAGYIISLNSFGHLKRNNFVNIHLIIIDEFIPEEIDIRHLQIARKVASVVQTVARRQNVKIYMLGNSIRLDDLLLVRLGLGNMKIGEIRTIKDKYGLLVVGHYVNPKEYETFTKASESSVAGRLATLLGEDNLDKNVYKQEIESNMLIPDKPKQSHLLFCIHGQVDSIRINITKDASEYYVMTDYGKNRNNRICLDEKFMTPIVQFRPEWRDVLLTRFSLGQLKFESSVIYLLFKNLLKLDVN